ncbi:MAG: MFS transporter [Alphaproteobacteria bacterium]|nr:MFS transporter [Alphaproteobacteria bacterium]
MHGERATTGDLGVAKGSWSELFRNGLGLYSALVIGGIAMNATQMLVIAIIMPTIVRDIGGASFYTWAAMLYTIGSIVGGASTGMVWGRLGARCAYTLGAGVFALGTLCCALAPNIGALIAARSVQGWAGGLVSGSGMALITSVFDSRLRTRIIAISQGTFTACHLSGPIVGGMFAAMHWWRGSFWMMAPLMLVFAGLAYCKIPDRLSREAGSSRFAGVPFFRFGTLGAGVLCVAGSGSVPGIAPRILLIMTAVALVGLTFRLDRRAADNLFPRGALSLNIPIGLALWILALHGMTQTSVTLFLPLLLQVVHQVSPLVINFLSIVISIGWTTGTFTVSGWSGKRERLALAAGPVLAATGLACLTAAALLPGLALMTASAFVMGIGIGIYNVHLVARAMDSVAADEQRTTAAALASVRSIGTAFGAAIAGVVANIAGLGGATEPAAVGHAVTAVYMFCCIPFGLAALLMFRFIRVAFGNPGPVPALAGLERRAQ